MSVNAIVRVVKDLNIEDERMSDPQLVSRFNKSLTFDP